MQNKIQNSFLDTSVQENPQEKSKIIGSRYRENIRNTEVGYLCETAGAIGGVEDLTAQLFYNCYQQGANFAVPRQTRFVYFQP